MPIIPGEGTDLQIKIATVFTTIARVEEIDGPESTIAAIKSTVLKSTAHEYRPSRIPDPGKISLKIQFDPNDATHQLIAGRIATPAAANDEFKLIFNDGMAVPANATFFGFFTKFKPTGEKIEENVLGECEVQCTTMPDYNPGAPA